MPRFAALALAAFAALMLFAPPGVHAQGPYPNSTLPAFIRLVGSAAGVPDTVTAKFTVTVLDFKDDPVPDAFVMVDFSGCADIRLASDQLNPNYTVSCAGHTVGAWTNSAGKAVMTLLGSSWDTGTHSGLRCARIYANGVLLGSPDVAAFDLNGVGGLTAADIAMLLGDFGSQEYRARSDFDDSGFLSAADLSVWLGVLGGHRSSVSSVACP